MSPRLTAVGRGLEGNGVDGEVPEVAGLLNLPVNVNLVDVLEPFALVAADEVGQQDVDLHSFLGERLCRVADAGDVQRLAGLVTEVDVVARRRRIRRHLRPGVVGRCHEGASYHAHHDTHEQYCQSVLHDQVPSLGVRRVWMLSLSGPMISRVGLGWIM